MENLLRTSYGRRITPGVKIFTLIVIIFLGLRLAFTEGSHGGKTHTPASTTSGIPPGLKNP